MKGLMKAVKVFVIFAIVVGIGTLIAIFSADKVITEKSNKFIFDTTDNVPLCKSALVLGCAKTINGKINYFFKYRIEAATELYKAGKIQYIIVSGDNSTRNYNEPQDMKNALVESGIPEEAIFLDYAGFRTLDSVIRMKEIFSQERYIIVSQEFHNQRAIFLSRRLGMETYAYNAQDLEGRSGQSTHIREKFARLKAFFDLLTNKQPKFLGEKVALE